MAMLTLNDGVRIYDVMEAVKNIRTKVLVPAAHEVLVDSYALEANDILLHLMALEHANKSTSLYLDLSVILNMAMNNVASIAARLSGDFDAEHPLALSTRVRLFPFETQTLVTIDSRNPVIMDAVKNLLNSNEYPMFLDYEIDSPGIGEVTRKKRLDDWRAVSKERSEFEGYGFSLTVIETTFALQRISGIPSETVIDRMKSIGFNREHAINKIAEKLYMRVQFDHPLIKNAESIRERVSEWMRTTGAGNIAAEEADQSVDAIIGRCSQFINKAEKRPEVSME